MLQKLSNLIEVKKLIALMISITFIILSLAGVIPGDSFINIFLMIIGYYFGQSTAKANKETVNK